LFDHGESYTAGGSRNSGVALAYGSDGICRDILAAAG
jgi:hypothetical protein